MQGAWKPSLNIGSVLTTVQLLMTEPNPDDPLMTEIVSFDVMNVIFHYHSHFIHRLVSILFQSSEYKHNRYLFNEKAKKSTKKYAMQQCKVKCENV